ncbi:hypothetical protein EDEG_02416 [Edhazardia aedis USNM 41457]|uniref:Uncharacterized protein n=1 Tax=Edhazardia aedis (strain USNM 41457) TaxID=1003232 RepID=J9D5Z1_EDHAE|nr:hypothetical protein EDEG_02416 [Edhazardia aedis USNM 41457]|eukprot:EJW03201.1 hypothetical protein EDEG_02416 [Edhazardia aedis USNM 41457]
MLIFLKQEKLIFENFLPLLNIEKCRKTKCVSFDGSFYGFIFYAQFHKLYIQFHVEIAHFLIFLVIYMTPFFKLCKVFLLIFLLLKYPLDISIKSLSMVPTILFSRLFCFLMF